jgi:hypothetical protein
MNTSLKSLTIVIKNNKECFLTSNNNWSKFVDEAIYFTCKHEALKKLVELNNDSAFISELFQGNKNDVWTIDPFNN